MNARSNNEELAQMIGFFVAVLFFIINLLVMAVSLPTWWIFFKIELLLCAIIIMALCCVGIAMASRRLFQNWSPSRLNDNDDG
jgi:uncharacterized membrane protein